MHNIGIHVSIPQTKPQNGSFQDTYQVWHRYILVELTGIPG